MGYFGDPDGGHTIMFEIQFDDQGDTLTTVASAVTYGRASILADFNVDKADFGNPCTQPYRLRVFVDDSATPLCTNNTFGIIREF